MLLLMFNNKIVSFILKSVLSAFFTDFCFEIKTKWQQGSQYYDGIYNKEKEVFWAFPPDAGVYL